MRTVYCKVCILLVGLTVACARAAEPNSEGLILSIDSIKVEGNVSLTAVQILAKIRSRVGDTFDPAVAAEDAKRIAEVTGVEYSYYNTKIIDGKIQLTFVVVEKNIIRAIDFVGNKAFKAKTLLGKLGFKVGDYLDPALAEAYRSTIAEFYRKKGYAFVEVTLDAGQLSNGKVVYTIKDGPRVKVTSVRMAGNKGLKTGALKKTIKTESSVFFFWSKYYQEEELAEDVARMQSAYQRKGYLNSDVTLKREYNADKSKVRISFVINEGAAYKVEKTVFAGNQHFDNTALAGQTKLLAGQTYNQQKAELDTKQLVRTYRESGFINAQVERGIKFVSPNSVDVEYTVTEGQRFRIGQIVISGNQQTQDRVVRRILDEYDFQPGRWYNGDIARGDGKGDLEKNIQRMLLTEREGATITPVGDTPGQKDAQVNLIEGKTGMIMLGAGVSSDSGIIGQIVYEQRNFDISDRPKSLADFITGRAYKGGGQSLRVSLQPGTQISEYSVSFTEPYLNDKPVALDLGGSSWQRWRESYNEDRTKGYIGLEKRYTSRWRRSVGFRAENVKVMHLASDAPQEIIDVKGDNFLAGLQLGLGKDMTDDRFNPSRGGSFNISYEQVGGDHTFGIASAVYRNYKTLYEDLAERKTVMSAKILAATTVADAPPFEKFYAGGSGAYGIRGFEYRGVSTRGLQTNVDPNHTPQYKDPIGSAWIFLANTEVTVPLIGDNFAALFFIDSGTIDTGSYRVGAGGGIQILIPQWFGPVPMRFELAMPLMKSDGDKTQTFSFSVGRLF